LIRIYAELFLRVGAHEYNFVKLVRVGGDNFPDLILYKRRRGMRFAQMVQDRLEQLLIVGGRQAVLAVSEQRTHPNLPS
jgi:hypothetical protein